MFRAINAVSREVLSLDAIETIEEARSVAAEIESHESQPEVSIQSDESGEWVAVR